MRSSVDRTVTLFSTLGAAAALSCLLIACPPGPEGGTGSDGSSGVKTPPPSTPVDEVVAEGDSKPETAPPQSGVIAAGEAQNSFQASADHWFKQNPTKRVYIQVDKPLYKPGETIWLRSTVVQTATLTGASGPQGVGGALGVSYQLVSPKGSVVLQKRVQQAAGIAANDFIIPEGVQGGEYKIRVQTDDGTTQERPVIVSVYEPPRFKKKLDFVRKAYGVGDTVAATLEVKLPTGEPFVARELVGVLTLDGRELPRVKAKTDAKGATVVRVKLPDAIEKGDGILTVMVEDSGITESITRRVPIVLNKVKLSFFPEGGEIVKGLPSRVYFYAQNTIDKPADIEGRLVDDNGQTVTTFMSYHDGMGRFAYTPDPSRRYHVEITKPVGVDQQFPLPMGLDEGCNLRTYDDPMGVEQTLRVAVHCTRPQKVLLNAMIREQRLGTATAEVAVNKASVVHLKLSDPYRQGVARVTLFSETKEPLAERLFYRGWHRDLKIKVTPAKQGYAPRDQVTLDVETTDLAGKPVAAELAMAVVDDTVLSFADDKTAHLLAHLFLEEELPGKIEEPNFYFKKDKPKAPLALEMLLGTRGWRKFEWRPYLMPPPPPPPKPTTRHAEEEGMAAPAATAAAPPEAQQAAKDEAVGVDMARAPQAKPGMLRNRGGMKEAAEAPMPVGRMAKKGAAPPPRPMADLDMAKPMPAPDPEPEAEAEPEAMDKAPMPVMAAPVEIAEAEEVAMADGKADDADDDMAAIAEADEEVMAEPPADQPAKQERAKRKRPRPRRVRAQVEALDGVGTRTGMAAGEDPDWAGGGRGIRGPGQQAGWAKVRVFPVPTYQPGYDGPRTDFRETIYWNPTVKTDASGKASVSFYLSDAVTSFRVTSEGFGGGMAGRDETVLKSKLPFFMDVKVPLEVSAGDHIDLPLTVKNETGRALKVALTSSFGPQVKLLEQPAPGALDLASASGRTLTYPLDVVATLGETEIAFAASADGLKDEFKRTLKVVPLGFPRRASASGALKRRGAAVALDLKGALPGSMVLTASFFPSPAAEMISGVDSILREPHGCFEQASSANYPNIMVMQYLLERDAAEPAIMARSKQLLQKGYRKLVGYESPQRGYEWFGGNPGHEALTAYGLMEFVDMRSVYGDVDRVMIDRTKKWLYGRRDGKGSFERNSRALDSFGGASKEVTDAYIVWALTEAGMKDLGKELSMLTAMAMKSSDPYVVALTAGSQLNVKPKGPEGMGLARKLAGMQKPDGRYMGTTHSITRSGGHGLAVETTSLSIMSLLKAGAHPSQVNKAVKWLTEARSGHGGFGSTQATILALKALIAFDKSSRRAQAGGELALKINGAELDKRGFEKGHNEPIVFEGFGDKFKEGNNKLDLALKSPMTLPYTVTVDYRTNDPETSAEVPLKLATTIAKQQVKMGETVRVTATLDSTSDDGLPMTLIRIGIPGGLAYQTWQLKELVDKKEIAFYETRAREVIVYFRALQPKAKKVINIDLTANVPGTYTAPASRAYLYYTAEHKTWASPLKVQIAR